MFLNKKKGDYKWDLLIILILGLLVLGLVLYYIFGEYFTDEDIDVQVCRQSIILRNTIPDVSAWKWGVISFKEKYPLKCKTQVVRINYENVTLLQEEIARSIAGCWFLYGNGDYNIFPSADWSTNTYCTICSRIHVNPKVRKFYIDEARKGNKLDIKEALKMYFKDGQTYEAYLKSSGSEDPLKFSSFGSRFNIDMDSEVNLIEGGVGYKARNYNVPRFYDPSKGDLVIVYNNFISRMNEVNSANLVFFHSDGSGLSDMNFNHSSYVFNQPKKFLGVDVLWDDSDYYKFCGDWDGVPA